MTILNIHTLKYSQGGRHMKLKVEIQSGLIEVENRLRQEGFDVYKYGQAGLDADITVVTGIDEAYEEIQPAQYHCNGRKKMLVVDATNTSPNEIMKRIHRYFN